MSRTVFFLCTLLSLFVAGSAQAEQRAATVRCQGVDGDVQFALNFAVNELGIQVVEMHVTDPNVSEARAKIAYFASTDGVLNNSGTTVVGNVDLANPNLGRKGERVGGTVLGALRSIMVAFEADFSSPAVPQQMFGGQAVYLKKNGQELVQDLDCIREL